MEMFWLKVEAHPPGTSQPLYHSRISKDFKHRTEVLFPYVISLPYDEIHLFPFGPCAM